VAALNLVEIENTVTFFLFKKNHCDINIGCFHIMPVGMVRIQPVGWACLHNYQNSSRIVVLETGITIQIILNFNVCERTFMICIFIWKRKLAWGTLYNKQKCRRELYVYKMKYSKCQMDIILVKIMYWKWLLNICSVQFMFHNIHNRQGNKSNKILHFTLCSH
jgi:hypothetical protein